MINNPSVRALSPATTYVDETVGGVSPSSLCIKRDFTNYTGQDIYLKTQSNIPMVIPPTRNMLATRPHSHLEIRTTYTLNTSDAFVKTKNLIESIENNNIVLSGDARQFLTKMYEEVKRDHRTRSHNTFTMVAFQHIEDHEISACKTVYSRETDIIISFDRTGILAPHPNSNEGFNQMGVERNKELYGFAGTFVRVIDNERITPSWFYYSGRRVIEVPSVYEESRESGVYVSISSIDEGVLKIKSEFMSFEEAFEKIGLCRTQEEAIHCGDPSEVTRLETIRLQRIDREQQEQIRRLKHEDELHRLNYEREVNNLKQQNTVLKESIDIAAQRRDFAYKDVATKRDDFYDRKKKKRQEKTEKQSATMKFVGETLKYVPAIAAACIGTWAVMRQRQA